MAFYEAGDSKPLVQFTGERMAAFPDVPTAKELGVDIEYYMQRSVNGPPGMSAEAVEFYTNLFQRALRQCRNGRISASSDGLTCDNYASTGPILPSSTRPKFVAHETADRTGRRRQPSPANKAKPSGPPFVGWPNTGSLTNLLGELQQRKEVPMAPRLLGLEGSSCRHAAQNC